MRGGSAPARGPRRTQRHHRHRRHRRPLPRSPSTMLFDLRSRRRRRVVKSVYVFLALLIGVGLVGFGVGTGGNFGGIFNAAGGGGGAGTAEIGLKKALASAQKTARRRPSDPA